MQCIQERISVDFCSLDIMMTQDEVLLGVFFVGGKHYKQHVHAYSTSLSVHHRQVPHSFYAKELIEYMNGELTAFSVATTLDFHVIACGTPFQRMVWNALLQIPYGHTHTYKEIATCIGYKDGSAARAVGNAVGANPFGIVVPCHRVVPEQGGVGHFSGGDHIKRHLLALEDDTLRRASNHIRP